MPGHRAPSDEDRDGSGGPTDDDVLRRRPLEPHGVDADVEGRGRHGEDGRERVHRRPQEHEGRHLEGGGEDGGGSGGDHAGHERSAFRPLHQGVDIAVVDHVQGIGATGGQCAPGHCQRHQPEGGYVSGGHEHGWDRGDEQELDDPRFGEGDVAEDPRRHASRGRPTGTDPVPTRFVTMVRLSSYDDPCWVILHPDRPARPMSFGPAARCSRLLAAKRRCRPDPRPVRWALRARQGVLPE